jgi:hypothetical protein
MGLAASMLDRFDQAEQVLTQGLEIFLAAGDVTGVGLLLADFAILEGRRGEHERASRLRGAALEMERQSGQQLITNMDTYVRNFDGLVRGPLGQDRFQRLLDEGTAMTMEEAAGYALRRGAEPQPPGSS